MFVNKTLEGLDKKENKRPFLGDILDEIQQELGETKQLPTFTYNNNTRFIKFVGNTADRNVMDGVEIKYDDNDIDEEQQNIELAQNKKLD